MAGEDRTLRAYAGSSADDNEAIGRALQWVRQTHPRVGGAVLLHVPTKQNLRADSRFDELAKSVAVKTWRAGPSSGWNGGTVLSAWPDRAHLADIDEDSRTWALVVVGWGDTEVAAWLAARRPVMLEPAADGPQTGPVMLDPVVLEGLETLSILVNHGNNLAGVLDRRDAVNVLTVLHRGGHVLDPDAVYAWALADPRWHARGAERLREFASAIASGKRLRSGNPDALRPDLLDEWRSRARDRTG